MKKQKKIVGKCAFCKKNIEEFEGIKACFVRPSDGCHSMIWICGKCISNGEKAVVDLGYGAKSDIVSLSCAELFPNGRFDDPEYDWADFTGVREIERMSQL